MKIRVLFYKADWDGHLLDDAISSWTWPFNMGTGPYSHAEIWIPECGDRFQAPRALVEMDCAEDEYWGTCYTSTMRGDVKGVVKRPAAQVLKNPGRWDYIEIEIDEKRYENGINALDGEVFNNPGYDTWCIVSFICCPLRRWYKGPKWICSEICDWVLWIWNILDYYRCPSPRRLSRWLVDKGYKINHLTGS
jgi:hypothetical protein